MLSDFFFLLSSWQQFCDWLLVSSLFATTLPSRKGGGKGCPPPLPPKLIE